MEESDKPVIRNAAIYALADIGDYRAVQPLTHAVRDDGGVLTDVDLWKTADSLFNEPIPCASAIEINGIAAIQALGWFRGNPLAREALCKELLHKTDLQKPPLGVTSTEGGHYWDVQYACAAAEALGEMGAVEALPELRANGRRFAGEADDPVQHAISRLESLRKSRKELLLDLSSNDPYLRYFALCALAKIGKGEDLAAIEALCSDDRLVLVFARKPTISRPVRAAAKDALEQIASRTKR